MRVAEFVTRMKSSVGVGDIVAVARLPRMFRDVLRRSGGSKMTVPVAIVVVVEAVETNWLGGGWTVWGGMDDELVSVLAWPKRSRVTVVVFRLTVLVTVAVVVNESSRAGKDGTRVYETSGAEMVEEAPSARVGARVRTAGVDRPGNSVSSENGGL
jgi:hypothetical protein